VLYPVAWTLLQPNRT